MPEITEENESESKEYVELEIEYRILPNGTAETCGYKGDGIADSAFNGCSSLVDLIIWGDSDIGDYAFAGCSSIEDVSISVDAK